MFRDPSYNWMAEGESIGFPGQEVQQNTEDKMRRSIAVGLVLASFADPVLADSHTRLEGPYRHHIYRRTASRGAERIAANSAALAPVTQNWMSGPWFVPYPPGKGHADGLSRRSRDCNKGCIGGNPG
jgi:hypothetical protein